MEYKDGVYSVDSEKDDDWLRTPKLVKEEHQALDMALETHEAEQKKGDGDSPRGESEGGKGMGDDDSDFVFIGDADADKGLLPLASRERAWDRDEAVDRVRTWAAAEDAPNTKYASAFMWHDPARAAEYTAYKLPFVDVVDGQAMAVPKGVFAINQRLAQTHMPEEAKEGVKRKVSAYYAQMREQWEDPNLRPAWEEDKKSALDALLEKGQAFLGALKDAFAPQEASAAQDALERIAAVVEDEKAVEVAPAVIVDGYALPEADYKALSAWLDGEAGEGRQMGGFAFKARDGRDWWFQWTTNAFMDREGEIFTTASLDDCIARNAEHDVKGQFWFWHIPGTKFGDVRWQARVGRFLVEAGPFDETPVGQAFKSVFKAYPYGHPVVSPEGWGCSHGFFYSRRDREDGVFERFAKKESTVLPARFASNPHNPQPFIFMEGKKMKDHERAALEALGGKDFVAQIVTTGEQLTKELEEAGIAFKSMDEEEGDKSASTIAQLRAVAEKEADAEIKKVILAFAKDLEAATREDGGAEEEKPEPKAKDEKAKAKSKPWEKEEDEEEDEEEEEESETKAGAMVVAKEEEEEEDEEEKPEAKKEAVDTLTRQEVADALAGVVSQLRDENATALTEAMKGVVGQLTQELAPLVDAVAEMKRADDERLGEKAQETPAASLHEMVDRAIGAKATKLTKRQAEKAEKGGPAQAEAADNGPFVTGVPLVDAFINEGMQG